MKYSKHCPSCGVEQIYTSKSYLTKATKNNIRCKSCAKTDFYKNDDNRKAASIYQGGSGDISKHKFSKTRLEKWSKHVRQRDCHCQMCLSTENLEAHHIFPKALLPDLAYDTIWGIALCKPCHIELHKELLK